MFIFHKKYIFYHLKLEIASAIPALNDKKYKIEIFTHLKLCLATATNNSKGVKITLICTILPLQWIERAN